MGHMIGAIMLAVIAIVCFMISYLQFNEKGFLFNNAYIYASKQEREKMVKKPYYKQSGVVFSLIGIIFLMNSMDVILQAEWLFYCVIVVAAAAIGYAIISTIIIEKKKKSLS